MADIDFFGLMYLIQTQYPQLGPILNKPGVFDLFQQAMNEGWDDARLKAGLQNTEYFRNTTQERRAFDVEKVVDPASVWKKTQSAALQLQDAISATGVHVPGEGRSAEVLGLFGQSLNIFAPPDEYSNFLDDIVSSGWDTSQIKYALMARYGSGATLGGELADNTARIMKMADDYAVPLSDQSARTWASQLTGGMIDENAVRGYVIEQSKSLFPGLTDALDRGITVRQYADPYLQIAQQELGIDPATVSMTDPKWNKAVNNVDPKTGQRVSMSLADWTANVRSDQQYGYDRTEQGRTRGAQLSTSLANMMGALG